METCWLDGSGQCAGPVRLYEIGEWLDGHPLPGRFGPVAMCYAHSEHWASDLAEALYAFAAWMRDEPYLLVHGGRSA